MKSVLSKEPCEKAEKPFPKLMIHEVNSRIILFTGVDKGICVYKGEGDYSVGESSNCWSSKFYDDYEGSVCLSND